VVRSRLSSIAEIVSSAAILLTLFYLAIQTNQISEQTELTNAALLSAARQESLNAELGLIYEYARAAPLAVQDFGELNQAERLQMSNIIVSAFRIREGLWWQHQNGVLDSATWESYRSLMLRNIRELRSWREVWEETKREYDVDFVEEIEVLLMRQN
jgi:hypothetical protein